MIPFEVLWALVLGLAVAIAVVAVIHRGPPDE